MFMLTRVNLASDAAQCCCNYSGVTVFEVVPCLCSAYRITEAMCSGGIALGVSWFVMIDMSVAR